MLSSQFKKNEFILKNSETDFEQNHKKIDFAILTALPEEAYPYFKYFSNFQYRKENISEFEFKVYEYNNNKILVGCTGFGTTFASSIVTLIHQNLHPEYILFSGTAGGIYPGMKLCDVVIAENAFEAEIQNVFLEVKGTPFESCLNHPLKNQIISNIYKADPGLFNIALNVSHESEVYKGTVVSSNAFPAPQEIFDKIKSQNPYAIDMETSAAYQIAWLLKIKVLAVRGISNILNSDGTDENVAHSDVEGSSEAAARVVLKIIDKLTLKN